MNRRHFQHREDFLEKYSDAELLARYRVDRGGLEILEEFLNARIRPPTNRNHSLTAVEKLLICLRYLASNIIQLNDGDLHRVSGSTVSRAVKEVINAFCEQDFIGQQIVFVDDDTEMKKQKETFYHMSGFPNVIALIDGTHIEIQAPTVEEPAYVNRMGYHSINVQLVFNGDYKIIDCVARWPGATHDSRMLRESGLFELLDGRRVNGHNYLLGDSGYPCKRWLLTPFLNPVGQSQNHYNIAHKRTRALVERGIGQLKRRWGILNSKIRMEPVKTCKVILVCAALHNFCKDRNLPILDQLNVPVAQVNLNRYHGAQDGLRYRDHVANTFF